MRRAVRSVPVLLPLLLFLPLAAAAGEATYLLTTPGVV